MANFQKNEIPVYLFMGFLDSGKTSFIQDTLEEDYFNNGDKTLLIACEEGEEGYDDQILEDSNTTIVYVDDEEDLSKEYFQELIDTHRPERILIEHNGMWSIEKLCLAMEGTPMMIYQTIVMVNAETFDLYMNNMRSLAVEMFKIGEMIIFNRCTKDTPRATYRRSIKAVNRRAQVMFESGEDLGEEEEALPFDVEGDEIVLEDEDFGIWFVDAGERPDVYRGKTITMKTLVFKSVRFPKGTFVPGRHAMTCCADDIQFIGYLCHTNHAKSSTLKAIKNKMWIMLTAEIRYEYNDQYGEEGPVLYAKRIESAEKPEDPLIYF